MILEDDDLERLSSLRARFLDVSAAPSRTDDYWRDDADLAAYDAVFAQRIGWKWDAVLGELTGDGLVDRRVVDWGCGTGIAARRFVARFGAARVGLLDRSARAVSFARRRLEEEFVDLQTSAATDPEPDVLLISHVINELEAGALGELLELVRASRVVIWVESGSHAASRRLGGVRDSLASVLRIVAPCPHAGPCGALVAGAGHWCHFHARPPAWVFGDADWARIGRELGLDLRSLPYSFLALERRSAAPTVFAARAGAAGTGAGRVLGRPDVRNKQASLWLCNEAGLERRTVFKGREPELFRLLRRDRHLRWLDGEQPSH